MDLYNYIVFCIYNKNGGLVFKKNSGLKLFCIKINLTHNMFDILYVLYMFHLKLRLTSEHYYCSWGQKTITF